MPYLVGRLEKVGSIGSWDSSDEIQVETSLPGELNNFHGQFCLIEGDHLLESEKHGSLGLQ